MDKTSQQALVTNRIDQPRNTLAVFEDPPNRSHAKIRSSIGAGDVKPMPNVVLHFGESQRTQVITNRDPLSEWPKRVLIQPIPQLRLAQQNDLDQFPVVRFKVGNQAHL